MLNSIHSSRVAFSSLHTQHGYYMLENESEEEEEHITPRPAEAEPEGLSSCPIFALVAVARFVNLRSKLLENKRTH